MLPFLEDVPERGDADRSRAALQLQKAPFQVKKALSRSLPTFRRQVEEGARSLLAAAVEEGSAGAAATARVSSTAKAFKLLPQQLKAICACDRALCGRRAGDGPCATFRTQR